MKLQHKILSYKDIPVFEKLRVTDFKKLSNETHKGEACFFFVNEGRVNIRSQTELIETNKDIAVLAKCHNYYYETLKKPNEEQDNVEVVDLYLYPELIKELFDFNIQKSSYNVDYNLKRIEINKLLENYKESINILLDNPELADDELIKNKLREFIILMTKTVKAPSELDFLASMFKPSLAKFEEVIKSNLYSNLSLKEYANLCHMSLSTFKRTFIKAYSESPGKYFAKKKIEKALTLLQDKSLRISDIAFDLGFDSLTTFNRIFKEQIKKTPSEVRMNLFD